MNPPGPPGATRVRPVRKASRSRPARSAPASLTPGRGRARPGAGADPRASRPVARAATAVPRRRLVALLLALMVGFGAVGVRLAFVQGFSAQRYAAIGVSQRTHTVTLAADRGSIFDRNGAELAISVAQSTVWADPHLVEDPAATARALSEVLHVDVPTLQDRLTKAEHFVYIARKIDDDAAARVKVLNLKGIFLISEPKRFEPAGPLAASVLGTVGTDNEGLSGLEVAFDKGLAGRPGRVTVEQDPSGKDLPGGERQFQPSARGSDLVLTLDRSLQYETEQDLAGEILAANARGGMAAVMDTHTGEILAMVSLVAGGPGQRPVPAPSNDVVTRVYEPGSVNKLATISGALQEGIVNPSNTFAVPPTVRVADETFHDDGWHPVTNWSVTDILSNSSNVGTINIAARLGKDRIDSYLRRFGFGSVTALHFPGESPGILLNPRHWYPTSIATVPIGQGVAVTSLQILAAFNTVANGGVYVAPKLIKATVDPGGRTVSTPPSETHRVVSPQVAQEMTAMLTEVVRKGTATAAAIDGYTVAGKTGTARKAVEGHLGYKEGAYISSFAGFVPAERPAFTAMVVLDEPTPIFGGLVAAPVFAELSRYGLRELGVPPPAPDSHLFDGVPHAIATAVVGDPGGAPPPGAVPLRAAAPGPAPPPSPPSPPSSPSGQPSPSAPPTTSAGPTSRSSPTTTTRAGPPTTVHPTTTTLGVSPPIKPTTRTPNASP